MNLRSTAFLFGLSLAMLWLFGLMVASKRTTFDESLLMPSFPPDTEVTLESITIKRRENKDKKRDALNLDLEKSASGWLLVAGKNKVRLDENLVGKIIREIKNAPKIDESDVSPNPEINGLAHPQLVVTIKGKTGKNKDEPKTWKLEIGDESADETRLFVSASDRPGKALAVAKSSLESLLPPQLKDENSLRPRQVFEFNEQLVKQVDLKDKTELEVKKADDGGWRIVKPPMGPAEFEAAAPPANPLVAIPKKDTGMGGVKTLISKIHDLRIGDDDFVSPSADLSAPEYGLEPGKESLRIQVISGESKKEETLLVGKPTGKDLFFAHMENDPGIFMIGARPLDALREFLKKPGELRSTNILLVDAKKVDKLTIKIGKEELVLTHPEEKSPWLLQIGDGKPAPANDAAVKAVFDALEAKSEIKEFYDVEGDAAKKLDAEKVLDGSLGEISLFTESQPKKTKDDKKAEKKEEKKDGKAAVTLILGKADKDIVPVKRIQQDGTVSRFALAKASADKIIPADAKLAFLGTALPVVPFEDVDSLILERGKETLQFVRGIGAQAGRWLIKQPGTEQPFADGAKVDGYIRGLSELHARKWLQKIDEKKADLAPYGLDAPLVKATLVLKKTTPAAAASFVGMLGSPLGLLPLDSAVSWLATRELNKTETLSIRFGKETEEEKDKPGSFALFGGKDLLFLVPTELVKELKSEDFRDRSMVLAMQQIIDAGAVSAGPANLLLNGPIVTGTVHNFDPTKIKELHIDVHQYDLRKFHFVRQAAEKPKEKEKAKSDKPAPPPSTKGQIWQDQSGLIDFSLDSENVNRLVDKLARLQAERWVTLVDGPRPDFKLNAKEAVLTIDATLDTGKVTLTVGAKFLHHGYYAQSSAWPGAVFLLSSEWVETYLRGAAYFGKDRIARD